MPLIENNLRRFDLRLDGKTAQSHTIKSFLETAAFYLLLFTIFLAAIPFGSVELWSQAFVVLLISIVAAIRVISIFFSGIPLFTNGSLIFPFAGLLGLAIIQMIPWTIGNPKSILSIDPDATKNFILIFSGLVVAAEILLSLTNNQIRLKSLIFLVLTVGLGSALFGVLRIYFFNNSNAGLSSYFTVGSGFAQFINRNHFVYLTEMTIGLLLGLLIKGSLSEKYKFIVWVATGFLILTTIFSNSRGGIISLTAIFIIAAIIHLLAQINKRRHHENRKRKVNLFSKVLLSGVLACVVFVIAVITIAFVGGDTVTTRIESIQTELGDNNEKKVNRLSIWKPTLDLIKENLLFGVGFGGYSAAITKYDQSNGNFSIKQAHNDYLEILANGGLTALLLILVFAYIFSKKAVKQIKSRSHLRRSSCFGAILGITGVIIHNFVDFGLHALINALIFIVLIVIATAKIPSSDESLKFAA